jgi:hypothetical protein
MATLELVSIQAIPTIATKNSAGTVAQPGNPVDVWIQGVDYKDPVYIDGSTQPVTFQTPLLNTVPYVPAITWKATCLFTQQYAGQPYSIVASLPIGNGGTMVPIFKSTGTIVAPAPIPNPPPMVTLQYANFELVSSLNIPTASPVPFRVAGDFTWGLSFSGLSGKFL